MDRRTYFLELIEWVDTELELNGQWSAIREHGSWSGIQSVSSPVLPLGIRYVVFKLLNCQFSNLTCQFYLETCWSVPWKEKDK